MKKLLFFSVLILTFVSCNKTDDSERTVGLINTWKLIEQYADPGDGSGDYIPVTSNKTITFSSDNTFITDGNICSMHIGSNSQSTGTFNTLENTITPDDCFSSDYLLTYELKENRLFIYYPCIEGCGQKFRVAN